MKNNKQLLKKSLPNLFYLILVAATISISCSSWVVPTSLTGVWSSQKEITFREKVDGKYVFSKHFENISIEIKSDGTVEGKIGQAKLVECKVSKNRSSFGRFLHIKTDYIITGTLEGKINLADKKTSRKLSIPFNVLNNQTEGSIFESSGMNIFPFADMKLNKQNAK